MLLVPKERVWSLLPPKPLQRSQQGPMQGGERRICGPLQDWGQRATAREEIQFQEVGTAEYSPIIINYRSGIWGGK